MEPGAVLISVNVPSGDQKKTPVEYSTVGPTVSAGHPMQ
jgi:hypothetical protein